MRCATFIALAMFVLTAPANAQQVTEYDLSVFGLVTPANPIPLDTDGDATTDEYLIGPSERRPGGPDESGGWDRRVVAIRDGQLCFGPWFIVNEDWSLVVFHGRTAYTRTIGQTFQVMTLDTPICEVR